MLLVGVVTERSAPRMVSQSNPGSALTSLLMVFLLLANTGLWVVFGLTDNETVALIGAVSSLAAAGFAFVGQLVLLRMQQQGKDRDLEIRRLRREVRAKRSLTRADDTSVVVVDKLPEDIEP